MFGSILLAASMPGWLERVKAGFRPWHLLFASGLALSLLFIVSQVIWDAEYLRGEAFVAKFPVAARGSVSFKDWLPVWARDVVQMKKMTGDVEVGSRQVTIDAWEPEHRNFQVSPGLAATARVRTYYYPHWLATAQGQVLETQPAEDGALLIAVPSGQTNIQLDFHEPRRVGVARFVSVCAWLLIAGLFLVARARHFLPDSRPVLSGAV
jgi:hypothetical protein